MSRIENTSILDFLQVERNQPPIPSRKLEDIRKRDYWDESSGDLKSTWPDMKTFHVGALGRSSHEARKPNLEDYEGTQYR